jgi:hypothetical protein
MSYDLIKKSFICFLISFFIFSFNNHVFAGGGISIKWGKGSDSGQPKSAKKTQKGRPTGACPCPWVSG